MVPGENTRGHSARRRTQDIRDMKVHEAGGLANIKSFRWVAMRVAFC